MRSRGRGGGVEDGSEKGGKRGWKGERERGKGGEMLRGMSIVFASMVAGNTG